MSTTAALITEQRMREMQKGRGNVHACTFMYELTSQQAATNAKKDLLVVHTQKMEQK